MRPKDRIEVDDAVAVPDRARATHLPTASHYADLEHSPAMCQLANRPLPAPATAARWLATERLRATLGDDAPKLLPPMITSYLEAAARVQLAMAEWRAQGQAKALLREAHTLKSNSELFGALELAALYRDLEQHAKDGGLQAAEALMPRIEAERARVQAALNAILPTL